MYATSQFLAIGIQFSFSKTGCYTKIKELSLPYYSLMAGEKIINIFSVPSFVVSKVCMKIFSYNSGILVTCI